MLYPFDTSSESESYIGGYNFTIYLMSIGLDGQRHSQTRWRQSYVSPRIERHLQQPQIML